MLWLPLWQPNITYGKWMLMAQCSCMIYLIKHCEFKRSCVGLPEGIREDQWWNHVKSIMMFHKMMLEAKFSTVDSVVMCCQWQYDLKWTIYLTVRVKGHWPEITYHLVIQHSHGKSPCSIGKPSINGPFSMAMWNNQRVSFYSNHGQQKSSP